MSIETRLTYAIIMMTALAVGFVLLSRRRSTVAMKQQHRGIVGIAAFFGAMLGAKFPFLLEADWDQLLSGVIWFSDGKTILGGIFGGYLTVEIAKSIYSIRTRTGDMFAVPVAASVAIGRLGCFVAGCCYGAVTLLPWGVRFPLANDPEGVCRHPTQIYESLFHSIALCVLLVAERRRWFDGNRLKVYLMSYLLYRFVSEWIRPEPVLGIGLTRYQVASAVLFFVLIGLWFRDTRLGTPVTERPNR